MVTCFLLRIIMRIITPPLILHTNRLTLMFICNKKAINIREHSKRSELMVYLALKFGGMINYSIMYLLCLIPRTCTRTQTHVSTLIEGVSGSYINI